MSRLRHSSSGFLRSLQISREQVCAFVEGIDVDPFFYGEICNRACHASGVGYKVRTARELPDHAGGKQALLTFFRYARSQGKLISQLGGKRTLMIFFLDKDIDDLKRTKCRSLHVIYTKFYDVQNHIFKHANFARAASSALSIDRGELIANPAFSVDWCASAARRWREWIAICILNVHFSVPGPNYRVASQINDPINGPVDPTKYAAVVQAIVGHVGLPRAEIDRKLGATLKMVDRHLSGGTHDIVFKGKWYGSILEADLRQAFSGKNLPFNGVGNRAAVAMAATVDFSQPWADSFVRPLLDLVGRL